MGERIDRLRRALANLVGQHDETFGIAFLILVLRQPCRSRHEARTFEDFAGEILLSGLEFYLKLMLPRPEVIAPRLDGVFVDRVLKDREDPAPTVPVIGVDALHGGLIPFQVPLLAPLQQGGDDIMPVLEHIRLDHDVLPYGAFDRIPAALDERRDGFDHGRRRAGSHGDGGKE